MIELVFVTCLLASPEVCETRSLLFAETMSTRACVTRAQPELARWSESNLRWRITRWSCRPAGSGGRKA